MQAPVQSSSNVLSKLRSSFVSGASFKLSPQSSNNQPPSTTQDDLDLLDKVISDVEAESVKTQDDVAQVSDPVLPQAFPAAVDQVFQEQQQTQGRSTAKESLASTNPDQNIVEAGTGIQYVEQEKSPEIPVEVEGFLKEVEDHADQAPQEIVIADDQHTPLATHYPKKSVVVLPITPEMEDEGIKKNPGFSIRWLVEWSRKLMKIFSGKIIYREVEQ